MKQAEPRDGGHEMNPIFTLARTLLLMVAVALPVAVLAAAQDESPEALVKSTSEEMLAIIARTQDRQQLLQAVETKVAPHFNFARMTQLALGRSWQQASPAQQKALEQEFRKLLVRTYANAFATARQRKASLKVSPRASVSAEKKEAMVKTQVVPMGGQPISIDYEMELSTTGWKVFDVMVDNISLVTNYRESFAAEIKKGGIDGLINALNEKNRKPAAAGTEGGAAKEGK